ncbi:glycosyltransferase domain-containing protein [Agromyces aerolatus]|uniref:glycosyltransferase domain-containing protein n=1 Tax=Agromyces sp. LY-1074 TaxID=3074080 RepID=UPI002862AC3C|nr:MULTISPECIES: glycosyltransferase domain-containing protein [unclassified Agromyces]MDR5700372.1 DUF616 domain-containing protein [Agromyces sp. LY-1074]MDR5706650.1 DUF616 domain-containing protein [Agromyces sp. LY-1358]
MSQPPRRAVYTAIFGGYEQLHEQPMAAGDDALPFICFTDDPELTSETWEVRVIPPRFRKDLIRSARHVKIEGHPDLSAFDETLWIDNTVHLHVDPNEILDAWLDGFDLGLPKHSYRRSVIAEFDAIAEVGYDDPDRVYEQLLHYLATEDAVVDEPPLWTALLARRHTDAVASAMRLWMDHVLRYSRRDQLSINYVLRESGLEARRVDLNNFNSALHKWPVEVDRKWGRSDSRFQDALRAPRVAVGHLQNENDELQREIEKREAEIARREAEIAAREADLAGAEGRAELAQTELANVQASASWRLTAGLRGIRARLRRRAG